MRERPIIFNSEMVEAVIDGRKTQTRRPVKNFVDLKEGSVDHFVKFNGNIIPFYEFKEKGPFGKPGDRLWVRETWRVFSWHEGCPINVEFKNGGALECDYGDCMDSEDWEERMMIQSAKDCEKAGIKLNEDMLYEFEDNPCRWRASIHMPRWASRITLEITDVRVERIQGAKDTDIYNEGGPIRLGSFHWQDRNRAWFEDLWNSIYRRSDRPDGYNKYDWDNNPWVWVVEFKRV